MPGIGKRRLTDLPVRKSLCQKHSMCQNLWLCQLAIDASRNHLAVGTCDVSPAASWGLGPSGRAHFAGGHAQ